MRRVCFICTHNTARSQMAEGFLRHFGSDRFEAFSAGTKPRSLDPLAVRVMAESGIDISAQHSKSVDERLDRNFDLVITVCDQARESCPVFPGATQQSHWSFPDPSAATGSNDERLYAFRRVRDEIADCVRGFVAEHGVPGQRQGT